MAKKRHLPTFLSTSEVAALLAAARCPRDRIIFLLGLYLGLRVSEIVGLRVERISWEARRVLVYQGKGGKDRYVPIPQRALAELAAWCAGRAGWVFPARPGRAGHLGARAVHLLTELAAGRAGIRRPEGQTIHPHTLRHTYACRLLETGASISEVRDLLGHASVSTTQVYLHCVDDRLRAAADRL